MVEDNYDISRNRNNFSFLFSIILTLLIVFMGVFAIMIESNTINLNTTSLEQKSRN